MIIYDCGVSSAPCKVNLTLDVFAPRADGYHDLDSVTARFSPHDDLEISYGLKAEGGSVLLQCDDPGLPTDDRNLAHKAATLFQNRFDVDYWQIVIRLSKRLPHQAGLGGGSSDAATVLSVLYDAFHGGTPESLDLLHKTAARIGSDVLLFLLPGWVRIRGRGDIAETVVAAVPTLHGVIVKPFAGVSTPDAYRLLDALPSRTPGAATQTLLSVLQSSPSDTVAIAKACGNDFEAAILPAFPEIAAAHQALTRAGAVRALLCGSGSACFGFAQDAAHAETIARKLTTDRARFAWVAVAQSLP